MTMNRLRPRSIALIAVAAIGLVWFQQSDAPAAPPSNDTCSAAVEVPFGTPFSGSTKDATNDYTAATLANPEKTLAPSLGGDVVYTVVVPTNESAFVSVKAGFAVSLYASDAECGTAAIAGNAPVVSGGPSLALAAGTWSVIVDGWTSGDKGNFTIAVSTLTPAMASADPAGFNNMAKEIAALKKKLAATKETVDQIWKKVKK